MRKRVALKQAIPNPCVKIHNIYELNNLDDCEDRRILMYNLCKECEERSRKCQTCKMENRQSSIEEIRELEMIRKSIKVVKVGPQLHLQCNYPIMGNPETLYDPDLSNRYAILAKSKSLFRKLHKLGLAQEFDEEIQKSLAEGHIRFLSENEEKKISSDWHCFSGLSYSIKQSSSTQKIRPCCDSSLGHNSGSLNSKLPLGPNLLNEILYLYLYNLLN